MLPRAAGSAARAAGRLSRLEVDEIVAFDRFFLERVNEAYRTDLWEVAYLMNDGCSDDGFDYFRGWLISGHTWATGNSIRASCETGGDPAW